MAAIGFSRTTRESISFPLALDLRSDFLRQSARPTYVRDDPAQGE